MRLLLAEDEKELASALKRILEHNKYDVEVVYNGKDAYDSISDNKYDAVVLDVMMPKMDGIEVVKKIREDKNNVPVIMLTAKAEIDDKVAGLDAGADDYLTKPFGIKELLARIRSITRRKGEVTESYKFGETVLNPDTFEITSRGGSVRLTGKEYRLMEYFIRNHNIMLSSEKIMENVWEIDSEAEINTVWVFVHVLRKKMESVNCDCYIKAVRGVGYSLEKLND